MFANTTHFHARQGKFHARQMKPRASLSAVQQYGPKCGQYEQKCEWVWWWPLTHCWRVTAIAVGCDFDRTPGWLSQRSVSKGPILTGSDGSGRRCEKAKLYFLPYTSSCHIYILYYIICWLYNNWHINELLRPASLTQIPLALWTGSYSATLASMG